MTERERHVLTLVALGYSNEEIGRTLLIGTETVKTHLKAIFRKLEARSRAHAVYLALLGGHIQAPLDVFPGSVMDYVTYRGSADSKQFSDLAL